MSRHNFVYNDSFSEVLLTPLDRKDIFALRDMRNSNRESFLDSRTVDGDGQLRWFEEYLERRNDFVFSAYDCPGSEKPVGFCSLYNYSRDGGFAEFGRLVVDPEHRGRRLGERITAAACSLAFEKLGVDALYLYVLKRNERACKIYQRLGFVEDCELSEGAGEGICGMRLSRKKWQGTMLAHRSKRRTSSDFSS